MKCYKASTKRGQQIIKMGESCIYNCLEHLYKNYSLVKERAFDWCKEQYFKTENATGFGVGNANSFGFTASWFGTLNGENIMRVETKDNTYIVYLDR